MEKVIYRDKGGCGLILNNENESDFIEKESVILHGFQLNPDSLTTMDGLFTKPIRYAGLLKNDNSITMCFHTGDDSDLFDEKAYYYCFFWIDENRIANKYTDSSVRDFIWKNGKWK